MREEPPFTITTILQVTPLWRMASAAGTTQAPLLVYSLFPKATKPERDAYGDMLVGVARRMAAAEHPMLPRLAWHSPSWRDGPFQVAFEEPHGTPLADIIPVTGPVAPTTAFDLLLNLVDLAKVLIRHDLAVGYLQPSELLLPPEGPPVISRSCLTALVLRHLSGRFDYTSTLWPLVFPEPRLVPPELLASSKPDPRTDQYVAACLVYYLVTGRYPYDGATTLEVYNQIKAGTPLAPVPTTEEAAMLMDGLVLPTLSSQPSDRTLWNAAVEMHNDPACPLFRRGSLDEVLGELRTHAGATPLSSSYEGILTIIPGAGEPTEEAETEQARQIRKALMTLESIRQERDGGRRRRGGVRSVSVLLLLTFIVILLLYLATQMMSAPSYDTVSLPSTGSPRTSVGAFPPSPITVPSKAPAPTQ